MDNTSFIRHMPKVELHAHLSGSISNETIRELIELHRTNYPEEQIPLNVINAFKTSPKAESKFKSDKGKLNGFFKKYLYTSLNLIS